MKYDLILSLVGVKSNGVTLPFRVVSETKVPAPPNTEVEVEWMEWPGQDESPRGRRVYSGKVGVGGRVKEGCV